MGKYRKKPVVIEAVQWTSENNDEIKTFCGEWPAAFYPNNVENTSPIVLLINTLEGQMQASVGDYIIKGVDGEFYPCKPDIFEKTYDSLNYPCRTCFYYEQEDDECGYFGHTPNNPDDDCGLWLSKDGRKGWGDLEEDDGNC